MRVPPSRGSIVAVAAVLLVTLASCQTASPVTLQWTSPADGATVEGPAAVLELTGQGLVNVELFAGGRLVTRATVAPDGHRATATLDTTAMPDGRVTLTAHGWNSPAGTPFTSEADAGARTFTIANAGGGPPAPAPTTTTTTAPATTTTTAGPPPSPCGDAAHHPDGPAVGGRLHRQRAERHHRLRDVAGPPGRWHPRLHGRRRLEGLRRLGRLGRRPLASRSTGRCCGRCRSSPRGATLEAGRRRRLQRPLSRRRPEARHLPPAGPRRPRAHRLGVQRRLVPVGGQGQARGVQGRLPAVRGHLPLGVEPRSCSSGTSTSATPAWTPRPPTPGDARSTSSAWTSTGTCQWDPADPDAAWQKRARPQVGPALAPGLRRRPRQAHVVLGVGRRGTTGPRPYIHKARQWFIDRRVVFHTYWDSNTAFTGKLSNGQFGAAGEAYRQAFR